MSIGMRQITPLGDGPFLAMVHTLKCERCGLKRDLSDDFKIKLTNLIKIWTK